jgi:hypothetical protein
MSSKLEYTTDKNKLPKESLNCVICQKLVDVDQVLHGIPNCSICINGHRFHADCFDNWVKEGHKHKCPSCETDDIRRCKSFLGKTRYSYGKGGKNKKRKTNNRKNKQRKTNKSKKHNMK